MAIRWDLAPHLKRKKWTAYRLAIETGLTPSAIYKLEKKGDLRHIDVLTAERIQAALGLDSPWMLFTVIPE